MPRKTKKSEQEALSSLVNMNGQGEDPAVKAMLSDEFVNGSNTQALDIALALQTIIRGQNSLLENQDKFSGELERLRKRMDAMDKASDKWNEDREGFIQEVMDKASKLIAADGEARDKIIAKGSAEYTRAIEHAKADQVAERLRFEQELAKSPKVNVVSPGELVMVMQNGQPVAKIMNETVKIKHKKWVFPAGKVVEVPKIVADVLEQRRRTQQETSAREQLLAANLESSKLDAEWKEINNKFNSTTDVIPTI